MNSEYVFRLETLLLLYALVYDGAFPVVCFDERPCFLIGEVVEGLACSPDQVAKQHYAYSKHGSCVVMGAIEPLSGKRLMKVYRQRTKKEYTAFMQEVAAAYPDAVKIRLVQDNLNTHTPNAFYECLSAGEAAKLATRFELYYTPKCGSWLNMIEVEFSALSRQCLNRRIPTQDELEKHVLIWSEERNQKQVKITWQFTVDKARDTLNRQYVKVNPVNLKYKET
ncbi:IS630 family transposase [Spirosoma panaciterrae]|uniref:IS630 family transposase n=1 Tax=Spirosoma panaciterrae TaxID=496058 RepID=UPI000476DA59|nr:IS630 family transposase [Spirosoma panaciterrae]